MTHPIFDRWPSLSGGIPHVTLGCTPTPVERLEIRGVPVWVKRDDLTGEPYGGNKVRKLEFLLADAVKAGATETLTFGAAGSNHALATAVYASRLGLHPISMLADQPNATYVGRNLAAQQAVGAEIRMADHESHSREAVRVLQERESLTGRRPYVVPMGGTSPLGTLGFVDAGLEFAAQIAAGEAPVPDVLYVALGSMGTAAGIIIGLRAAGLPTRVVAVRVTPVEVADEEKLATLIAATVSLLREHGADVADVPSDSYDVRHDAYGEGYAIFTEEGMAAVASAEEAGLHLEGTYTGKTMGALLRDAASGRLDGMTVAFWDTYNSRGLEALGTADPEALPAACRTYLTGPRQELDR